MSQIDVSLTNFILAIESLIFVSILIQTKSNQIKPPGVILFISFGLAALLGGIHHGFGNHFSIEINSFIWWLTLLLVGISAYGFASIGIFLIFPKKAILFNKYLFFILVIYIACIILNRSFLTAILFYLPSVFFVSFGFYKIYQNTPNDQIKLGLYGLGLSLIASILQQLEVGVHPVYLTYNAVYHLILMIALFMFFIGLKAVIKLNP